MVCKSFSFFDFLRDYYCCSGLLLLLLLFLSADNGFQRRDETRRGKVGEVM